MNIHDDTISTAAVKAVPAGVGWVIYGLTLNDWVMIATLIYVVLQIILLIPKFLAWYRDWLLRRNSER